MRLCASIFTKTKMYYLQNKKLLIILSIWYNYLIALNEAFELTDVTPTTRIGKPKKREIQYLFHIHYKKS